jgi:hypothetical protein
LLAGKESAEAYMKNILPFMFLILIIYSCNSPTEKGDKIYLPPDIQDSTQITTENIMRAVYSSYKYPATFQQEDYQGASPYYENTISIYRTNARPSYWIELSTNDRNQAYAWSESSNVNSAYYRKIVAERETDKFFEFRRAWEEHPTDVVLSRIHKSTYLDRSMYDRISPKDTIAVFKYLPVDTTKVKNLIEYLWFAGNYNFAGAKVLCNYIIDRTNCVEYLLFSTEVSRGDWGLNDQIDVVRSSFVVSKQSGSVVFKKQTIQSLIGKRN